MQNHITISKVLLILSALQLFYNVYSQQWLPLSTHSGRIKHIAIGSDNSVWITTQGEGCSKLKDNSWLVFDSRFFEKYYSCIQCHTPNSIAIDSSGTVWLGTQGQNIYYYYGKWRWTYIDNPELDKFNIQREFIYSIAVDKFNNIWFGIHGGLVKYNGLTWTLYTHPDWWSKRVDILQIVIDHPRNLFWLRSAATIISFDGENWQNYNKTNAPFPNSWLTSMAVDSKGDLYVGTKNDSGTGELLKYYNSKWRMIKFKNKISCITVDNHDTLWIGTNGNGIYKYDGWNNFVNYNSANSELNDNNVWSIATDSYLNKWIGTYSGLIIYNQNGVILK